MITEKDFIKTGDPVKNAQWTALLIKKMQKLNVTLELDTSLTATPLRACMSVKGELYNCKTPSVMLSNHFADWSNETTIPVIMHELGHVVDLRKCKNSQEFMVRRMGTLEMEVSAWENAFRMAREIGYTNFKYMEEFAQKCLATYFDFYDKHGYNNAERVFPYKGEQMKRSEGIARLTQARKDAERAYSQALLGV